MASSIARSRRAALLLVSSTCAFHSSAVIATTPEQITAIRVSWMVRENASWVSPTVTSVGTTTTARTVTSVMARPLRPNWRPSQIAGKATAMPTAVDVREAVSAQRNDVEDRDPDGEPVAEQALADGHRAQRGDERR